MQCKGPEANLLPYSKSFCCPAEPDWSYETASLRMTVPRVKY